MVTHVIIITCQINCYPCNHNYLWRNFSRVPPALTELTFLAMCVNKSWIINRLVRGSSQNDVMHLEGGRWSRICNELLWGGCQKGYLWMSSLLQPPFLEIMWFYQTCGMYVRTIQTVRVINICWKKLLLLISNIDNPHSLETLREEDTWSASW